jgi:hypothetical protein
MTALIRTEWLKLRTTRGPWFVLGGLLALTALITPAAMSDLGQGTATKQEDAREVLVLGPGLLTTLVLLVLGTLAATSEFQHRTAVTTYLISPLRGRVLAAKLVAHAVVGALVAAVMTAVAFPIAVHVADSQGVEIASTEGLVGAAAAVVAAGALASVLGVALGSIIRNQTTAILVLLLWTLLAERFLFAGLPAILPFGGLLGAVGLTGDDGPSVAASLAAAAVWAAALATLARVRFIGRDVT